jgi:ribonuclease BN (tRNA processing enzyme)
VTELVFLGTKGEIEEETPRHRYHSSLTIASGGTKLLIDYGLRQKYSLADINPSAILITHAHPDPYRWLKVDEPIRASVYLTQERWTTASSRRRQPRHHTRSGICHRAFQVPAYRVIHSIRCPAVGWKMSGRRDNNMQFRPGGY